MRRGLAVIAAGVACAVLASCDGAPGQPQPTVVSRSSAVTLTSGTTTSRPPPTTSPSPDVPVLPAAAKEKSPAGAKAFVRYYVDVLNQAFAEVNPRLLAERSARGCSGCGALLTVLRKMQAAGGGQSGGDWRVLRIAPTSNDARTFRFVIHVEIQAGSSKRSADAAPRKIEGREAFDEITLRWQGHWLVTELRPA